MVKVKFKNLEKAAKKVAKTIKQHFRKGNKNGGWDLDYGFLVTDVFYEAFGHHLEDYLLTELCKSKTAFYITGSKKLPGQTVLSKRKPKKSDITLKVSFFKKKIRKKK